MDRHWREVPCVSDQSATPTRGIPYVTINGQKIDARDRHAIDEAFKQVA